MLLWICSVALWVRVRGFAPRPPPPQSLALLPCPRRLDGGVERQQIGLIRNALDLAHQHTDAVRLLRQCHGGREGMLCLGGQLRHPVLGIFQLLIGVLAVRLGLGYLVVRLQDIAGNLVGCRRHFGDGRRHLLGLDILFGDVGARLAGGCFQMHREILRERVASSTRPRTVRILACNSLMWKSAMALASSPNR